MSSQTLVLPGKQMQALMMCQPITCCCATLLSTSLAQTRCCQHTLISYHALLPCIRPTCCQVGAELQGRCIRKQHRTNLWPKPGLESLCKQVDLPPQGSTLWPPFPPSCHPCCHQSAWGECYSPPCQACTWVPDQCYQYVSWPAQQICHGLSSPLCLLDAW